MRTILLTFMMSDGLVAFLSIAWTLIDQVPVIYFYFFINF